MIKVAFICTHNSCRSQMAESIAKIKAADFLEVFSAGTHPANEINADAIETIKELYGVDIAPTQKPKLLSELPPVDILITMGCGVECPWLPSRCREDWGLADPTGKGKEEFIKTAKIIEQKITELKSKIYDLGGNKNV
jgi:arsenate reductase (thioredoxin)